MQQRRIARFEFFFILLFGVMHFAIPFLLPPNFISETTVLGFLRIADFVIPGCVAVAISAILYSATRNRYPAFLLAFLYGGGIIFHILYLSGLFPSVLIVPTPLISVAGIVVDALSIVAIYDFYRRVHRSIATA